MLPVILISILFSDASITNQNGNNAECITCHEETYMQALSQPFQHTVMRDGCTECHQFTSNTKKKKLLLWSSTFQTEAIIALGKLDENKKYQAVIEAIDNNGIKSKAMPVNILAENAEKLSIEEYPLKALSNVSIDRIKMSIFTEASISWNTDVPATSEIEYKLPGGKYRRMSSSKNLYTTDHRTILKGLKRNSNYSYRVISTDMSGNTMISEEQLLNTYNEIVQPDIKTPSKKVPTLVTDTITLKDEEIEDFYLKVASNKYSQFIVWLKEINKKSERPCNDSKPSRASTIDICIKCHAQDSSHPVGVRSNNPKVIVSDELPTIENGMITCVTCHFPHGGKKAFYVRIDFSEEICIKCHGKYYD